jgi:hypothetical protein
MSWAALRTISNATRAMDLNFLRLEMPGLRSVIADVQRRLKQYRQAIGLEDSAKRMPR